MSNEQQAKMVLERITVVMNQLTTQDGAALRWFFCFGNMLEYMCDLTFSLRFDIDLGIFYDEYDPKQLMSTWEAFGYECTHSIVHDKTRKAFNFHFEPREQRLQGTPTIDIFAFVPRRNMLMYTYDMRRERKAIPSKYGWKEIERELLEPSPRDVERIRTQIGAHPEMRDLLDEHGIWHYYVFEDHGPYKMPFPFAYGTLLDRWYPCWRFRQYYHGQSLSPRLIWVNSCEEIWPTR